MAERKANISIDEKIKRAEEALVKSKAKYEHMLLYSRSASIEIGNKKQGIVGGSIQKH